MKDINNWYGTGRLGHDADLRYTPQDLAVSTFSVAVDRGQDTDRQDKGTDWIDCIAFGRAAEAISRVTKKGSWIFITGPIEVSKYEGKDGQSKRSIKIIVREWRLLSGGKEDNKADDPVPGFKRADEDIPF